MSVLFQKIAFSSLLKLQLLYFVLGLGYNVISYIKAATGGKPLASTSPVTGAIFMVVYALILLAGYNGFHRVYRGLLVLILISGGYSGIIKHFIVYAQQPDAYSSQLAWIVAITINIFGAVLNLLAVAGLFENDFQNS